MEGGIEREIITFYENFLKEEEFSWSFHGIEWCAISEDKAQWLERPFEEEEVKLVGFSSDRHKSPGPGGFSSDFFQECRGVVKGDLLKVFQKFYRNGVINSAMNHTFLCLIPKKTNSRRLKD